MFKKSARLPKHKKFEFQPRFYNPDKEDFDKIQKAGLRKKSFTY